jgi:lysophospholipase L1-like esterase
LSFALSIAPSNTATGVTPRVALAEVICIGDSWLADRRANLSTELAAAHTGHAVIDIAAPGMEAADLADPGQPHLHTFRRALVENASALKRIYVSAGWDNVGSLLLSDCRNCQSPDECFDAARMSYRFSRICSDLAALLKLARELAPGAKVVLHNYDYAIPDGRVEYGTGKWLKVPLHLHKVPDDGIHTRGGFRREVVATLVDTYGEWLTHLAEKHPNATFCKTAGTLNDDDWQDEMHPTAEGYRKLATVLSRAA